MRISYLIALIIAIAVTAWIISGQDIGNMLQRSPEIGAVVTNEAELKTTSLIDEKTTASIKTVRTVTQAAVERSRIIRVRGQTEVSRSVVARSEIGGTIDKIYVSKGDRVSAGQPLVRLQLADRMARLKEITALIRQREIEYDIARSLTEQGHRPATALAAAKTALESAMAALERIELEISKTEIKAPFSGIIETRHVQFGDVIGPGNAVALIIDEDPFLVVGNVSETDINRVKVGEPGTARFLDGGTLNGTIRFVATIADPQTRTFRVELEVRNESQSLRAGLTTDLLLPVGNILAHFISPAALVLDETGALGVKVVNDQNLVEFIGAEVIASDSQGVWLDGLPAVVSIITVGHQFVKSGELVNSVADSETNN